MRILIIEDDESLATYIAQGLREEGHTAEICRDGQEGLGLAASEAFEVLIVDRMLPNLDGLALVKALRALGHTVPVLFLTALGDVEHRVEGLQAGGDDYLTKPFHFSELLARLESLYRRRHQEVPATVLRVADLELDLLGREARRRGRAIPLQTREFQLLEFLMRHVGQVVTRTMLLERVWEIHFDPQTNVIDVHISRLRGKIDRDFEKPLIHTIRGAGYVLREPSEAS
ncbi:MAG: response regulator transcription factor [Deltaproteobacteria bacterium]|nr:response regulator transcription factor [Deltaproteobacteria bacterium]